MMFIEERQLRKVIRDVAARSTYWVEPAHGSTDGLPDVFTVKAGVMHGMELKVGARDGGRLIYKVRPAQKVILQSLADDGAPTSIAVAEQGTGIVHVFDVELMDDRTILEGKVDLVAAANACRAQWDAASDPSEMHATVLITTGGLIGRQGVTWALYGRAAVRCFNALMGENRRQKST